MKNMKTIALLLLMLPVFLLRCDDAGESSSIYNFKVFALGGGFYGYYIVDGEKKIEFTNWDKAPADTYYTFEQSLNNPLTLEMRVDASNDPLETRYLEAKVFQDKKQVQSISQNKNIDNHLGFNLSYTFTSSD
jgi:hypothetical protein